MMTIRSGNGMLEEKPQLPSDAETDTIRTYEKAMRDLVQSAGMDVTHDLTAHGKVVHVAEGVIAQQRHGASIYDLDLAALGASEEQLVRAAAHREARQNLDSAVREQVQATNPRDQIAETIQWRKEGHDVGGEGYGAHARRALATKGSGFAKSIGGEEGGLALGNSTRGPGHFGGTVQD